MRLRRDAARRSTSWCRPSRSTNHSGSATPGWQSCYTKLHNKSKRLKAAGEHTKKSDGKASFNMMSKETEVMG